MTKRTILYVKKSLESEDPELVVTPVERPTQVGSFSTQVGRSFDVAVLDPELPGEAEHWLPLLRTRMRPGAVVVDLKHPRDPRYQVLFEALVGILGVPIPGKDQEQLYEEAAAVARSLREKAEKPLYVITKDLRVSTPPDRVLRELAEQARAEAVAYRRVAKVSDTAAGDAYELDRYAGRLDEAAARLDPSRDLVSALRPGVVEQRPVGAGPVRLRVAVVLLHDGREDRRAREAVSQPLVAAELERRRSVPVTNEQANDATKDAVRMSGHRHNLGPGLLAAELGQGPTDLERAERARELLAPLLERLLERPVRDVLAAIVTDIEHSGSADDV